LFNFAGKRSAAYFLADWEKSKQGYWRTTLNLHVGLDCCCRMCFGYVRIVVSFSSHNETRLSASYSPTFQCTSYLS